MREVEIKTRRKSKRIYERSISNWPEDDRPREKLFRRGEHTLSDTELLAILLRSGTRGHSAIDLARQILSKFRTYRNMSHTDIRDWKEIKGIGMAKIAQIKAAIEIGRRFRESELRGKKVRISSPRDVIELLMPRMRDLKKEIFKVLLLDSKNRVIDIQEVEEGTVNQANPIIREIISRALQNFAASIICVHNHPSGNPSPSREDRDFTRALSQAGNIMHVDVLDHIIIGDNEYFSFTEEKDRLKAKRKFYEADLKSRLTQAAD